MLQTIQMLDLRKKIGEVVDRTLYQKVRFLIKRRDKPVAVLIPLEDYELFIEDDKNIEIYSKNRVKEFKKQDRLTTKEKAAVQHLINL